MASVDNQEIKAKKDLVLDLLKSKYPEAEYADDDALFEQIGKDYEEYEEQKKGYEEEHDALADLFAKDPKSASFFVEWQNGKDPIVNLLELYGNEILDIMDDPERQAELAEANKKFLERVAKEKQLEEEYNKNIEVSKQTLSDIQAEQGLTDEQIDKAMEFIVGVFTDAIIGKFDRETIKMALKATNYDADVEAATQEGDVRGRNAKIKEQLRTRNTNDGVAQLNGKNNGVPSNLRNELGALSNYGDGVKDIWERGGMVRKKYNQ